MDTFDPTELLGNFKAEDEVEEMKTWSESNGHERSCTFETRLEHSDTLRTEGNDFYKAGELENAQHRYFAAVWQLDGLNMSQWGEGAQKYQDELDARRVKLLSNIAMSYLKRKDYGECKKAVEFGLKVQSVMVESLKDKATEAKLWYIKGAANLERGFADDAVECLKKADALTPGDKQVRTLLAQAGRDKRADTQKAKEVWKSTLLTQEEKRCQGPLWKPDVMIARLRRWLHGCCHRKKA
eukprot:TRINITY_DN33426_c0_g1_i1.p1 TRINITY_DN33426_c0_g1~~TRINITY_DN33426_c0_g1_i1.p1  ORF type:complete len:240 (-),score=50.36 TRINITY_DN33426_c0_g1_i1:40-759(-)